MIYQTRHLMFSLLVICWIWILPLSPIKADSLQVTFFGNNQFQPLNVDWINDQQQLKFVSFNLDAHKNLEEMLSAGLPVNDVDQATLIAKQRVSAVPQAQWDNLFVGPMLARKWGIQRYPAVVFGEGESVVYGVCDLQKAVQYWQTAQGELQ